MSSIVESGWDTMTEEASKNNSPILLTNSKAKLDGDVCIILGESYARGPCSSSTVSQSVNHSGFVTLSLSLIPTR